MNSQISRELNSTGFVICKTLIFKDSDWQYNMSENTYTTHGAALLCQ